MYKELLYVLVGVVFVYSPFAYVISLGCSKKKGLNCKRHAIRIAYYCGYTFPHKSSSTLTPLFSVCHTFKVLKLLLHAVSYIKVPKIRSRVASWFWLQIVHLTAHTTLWGGDIIFLSLKFLSNKFTSAALLSARVACRLIK